MTTSAPKTRHAIRKHDRRLQEEEQAQEARYAERFPDWRPSEALRCPRVVAGHRCRQTARTHICICEEPYGQAVLDHHRIWRRGDDSYALTTEPYSLAGRNLRRFIAHCEELGLEVEVGADSPYFPGHTTLIVVTPAD